MSSAGYNHSLEARHKIGLENQKDKAKILRKIKDYIKELKNSDFPSITKCAIYAGISEKRLVAYEITTEENSDIRLALDLIRDLQKASLMENGLRKIFDGRMSFGLLQANHGLRIEPTQLTQNNTFNVSPEILAKAIDISRTKK